MAKHSLKQMQTYMFNTYKIYLNFYNKEEMNITQEENGRVLKQIKDEFGYNENKDNEPHYPYFYNDRFYFGHPVVLTNVSEEELKKVLELYATNGYPKYWMTYKYRTYCLEELQKANIDIHSIRTLHNERVFLSDRAKIFVSLKSEVEQYVKGRGVIKQYVKSKHLT